MKACVRIAWCLLIASFGLALAGCTPKLRLAPRPEVKPGPARAQVRVFDFNGDGRAEYREILEAGGQVRYHEFDRDGDGVYEQIVDRARLDPNKTRHVFLMLDGVPYSLINQMWQEGHFRIFSRPGQMISTFPSLTDPAYYRIFHCGVPYGYEAEFFDRSTCSKTHGVCFYVSGRNEAWAQAADHRINFIEDAVMYLFPGGVFRRELGNCRRLYDRRKHDDRLVLYLLSTDGICHMYTRERAHEHFELLDRWIQQLVYDSGGQVHITMLADHGNNFSGCKYVDIAGALRGAGLHVNDKLRRHGDVVAPKFGLINFGSIFCYSEVERRKAAAVIGELEGIDAVAWPEDNGVLVANRGGSAAIHRKAGHDGFLYSYMPLKGDPLGLAEAVADLREKGRVDTAGFVGDADWFEATKAGAMPYAVPRLYDSLYTNVINTADIVVSLADGYYYGDRSWEKYVTLRGTHGGLSRESTVSFLMSSAFVSPEYVRTDQVLPVINQYVTWTPKLEWVDYAWLDQYRDLQGASAGRRDGSWPWPEAAPASGPALSGGAGEAAARSQAPVAR